MQQHIRDLLFPGKERSISDVPVLVIIILLFSLSLQITFQILNPSQKPEEIMLSEPPRKEVLMLAGLSDSIAMSRMTMLWLQAFDNQPGISIPFARLDYDRVIKWLDLILELDMHTQYPLLAASRIYTEVPVEEKKKMMLEFVYKKFFEDPDSRWPALAHAVYVAKHRVKDLPLALKYADALANSVTRSDVPFWVKQMNIYVLEDMNEIESAKVLLGGLIESGEITDKHELKFLQDRLARLEENNSPGN